MNVRYSFALLALCVGAVPAAADEFVLAGGGRIVGELANAAESPRVKYEVRLPSGGSVVFDKDQVTDVVRRTPDEIEYERIRHEQPDTIEGHWQLAEWCRDHKLTELRKQHLERVIEIEPNHVKARAALGYNRIQGQWRTQAEHLSALGKVQYKGVWRYPQEIQIIEAKQKSDSSRQLWYGNMKRWRDWLNGAKQQQAITELAAVTDPLAVPALSEYMLKEENEQVRKLYAEALIHIGSAQADAFLADRSLRDPSQEIRIICLDYLDDVPQQSLIDYYIRELRSTDNEIVRAAGVALSRYKDPRSIGPLIDALITKHKYAVTTGNPGGGLSATNGTGGSGLSSGSKTVIITNEIKNQPVLDSLITILGGKVNFGFEVNDWKQWYAGQKKQRLLDVRRS